MHPEDLMKPDLFSEIVADGQRRAAICFPAAAHSDRAYASLIPASSFYGGCYANNSSRLHSDRGIAPYDASPWFGKRAVFGKLAPG